jgi:hypothetical protein
MEVCFGAKPEGISNVSFRSAPKADIKRGYAPHQIMNLRLTRTHYGIHEPAAIAKRRSASD